MPDQTPEALAGDVEIAAADAFCSGQKELSGSLEVAAALLREQAAELAELRAVVEALADAVDAVLGMDRAATYVGHKPRLRDNDRNRLEAASKQAAAALAAKEASRG